MNNCEMPDKNWLDDNEAARASVLRGLEQAQNMKFVEPPDLREDEKLLEMIQENE
jgi:hypothetical protein